MGEEMVFRPLLFSCTPLELGGLLPLLNRCLSFLLAAYCGHPDSQLSRAKEEQPRVHPVVPCPPHQLSPLAGSAPRASALAHLQPVVLLVRVGRGPILVLSQAGCSQRHRMESFAVRWRFCYQLKDV